MLPGLISAIMGGLTSRYSIELIGTLVQLTSSATLSGNIDIGKAHPNKEIFIVSECQLASGTPVLTAVATTVDGVAVTKATGNIAGASSALNCSFVSLPTQGGVKTVTLTWDRVSAGRAAAVYKVVNRPHKGANQTGSSVHISGAIETAMTMASIAINNNGIWFGLLSLTAGAIGHAYTPTGTIKDYEVLLSDAVNFFHRDVQPVGFSVSDYFDFDSNFNDACITWAFD